MPYSREWELQWMQLDARRITLELASEDLRALYALLIRTRLIDERFAALRTRGLSTGSPTCRGFEAAQIGCLEPLHIGTDFILPYYRDLGVMVAAGMPSSALLLNQLSRADDPISGGRMRPAQWNSRALNIVSASGLIATQTLHAAGIAFAAKLRGENAVAMTFFGEGATSEGDFHEALNFAALHSLGVIFVCENNGVALSTPQSQQMHTPHVADHAAGFGIPGVVVDGMNLLAVIDAAREACVRARAGQGPTLLEVVIPRVPAPGEASVVNDPILFFRAYLLARGDLTLEYENDLYQAISRELAEAEAMAIAAPPPDAATVAEHLFATSYEATQNTDRSPHYATPDYIREEV